MKQLAMFTIAFVLCLPACSALLADDNLKDTPVKFVSMREGKVFGGIPCYIATVVLLKGGPAFDILVPDKDPNSKKLDPVEAVYNVLKEAKPGDILVASTFKISTSRTFTTVKAFVPKPGEGEPNCYVFVKKVEQGDKVGVTLSKMLQEQTLPLPTEKNAEGKMAANAELLKAVDGFKSGDVIMADIEKGTIKSIQAYEPPKKGSFVKATKQKIDNQDLPAVEIKEGESSTVYAIPKRNSALAGKANSLKAGQDVLFRAQKDDKGEWLADIWPALAAKDDTKKGL